MGGVLSIGKLATGQANYHLQQACGRLDSVTSVRTGIEDYYFDGPEPDGEWIGGGAIAWPRAAIAWPRGDRA
jgi:hypothetical protein